MVTDCHRPGASGPRETAVWGTPFRSAFTHSRCPPELPPLIQNVTAAKGAVENEA